MAVLQIKITVKLLYFYDFFFFFFWLLPFRVRHSGCFSNICTEDLAVFYTRCPSWRNLLIVGKLARPFNMLGCTLERNQLRHCVAKPIVQICYHSKHKWVFTPGVLQSRDQLSMSWTHYPLSHWGSLLWLPLQKQYAAQMSSSNDYSPHTEANNVCQCAQVSVCPHH